MIDREIIAYVKSAKQKGLSDEIIRAQLQKKDLTEKEISHALQLAESLLKENESSNSESTPPSSHYAKHAPTHQHAIDESGWSWGAFSTGPVFLLAIKKYYYLLLYLVCFIPLVNFFALLGIAIFLGIKGRELAFESSIFQTEDEARGFVRATDHAGFILFIFSIISFALALIFFIATFSFLFGMVHRSGAPVHFNTPTIPINPTRYIIK